MRTLTAKGATTNHESHDQGMVRFLVGQTAGLSILWRYFEARTFMGRRDAVHTATGTASIAVDGHCTRQARHAVHESGSSNLARFSSSIDQTPCGHTW